MKMYFAVKPQPKIWEKLIYEDLNSISDEIWKEVITNAVMIGHSTLADISSRLLGCCARVIVRNPDLNGKVNNYSFSSRDGFQEILNIIGINNDIYSGVIEDAFDYINQIKYVRLGLNSDGFFPKSPNIVTDYSGIDCFEIRRRFVLSSGSLERTVSLERSFLYEGSDDSLKDNVFRFKLGKFGVDLERFAIDEKYKFTVFIHPELVCHIVGRVSVPESDNIFVNELLEELKLVYGNIDPDRTFGKVLLTSIDEDLGNFGYIESHWQKKIAPLSEF